jgi:hypothetical protein
MKKIYTLVLAVLVGAAAMAADNGPHTGIDNRSAKENSVVRSTINGRINGNPKMRGQDSHYSSRYGNDNWNVRNDRNDNWAYARDRYDHNDRRFDRDDHYRGYDRNDYYNDHKNYSNDHSYRGYGNNEAAQRHFSR